MIKKITHNRKLTEHLEKTKQSLMAKFQHGTYLGDTYAEPVIVEDKEVNQHVLCVGTTGSGKTNTILNFVGSAMQRNRPCIYLDGKGSMELVAQLSSLSQQYNRKFKVFSLRNPANMANLSSYNPLSSGNATEWKNRIMSLFSQAEGKGQEHFSLIEQNYINFVSNGLFKLSKKDNAAIDLKVLLTFLEHPDMLIQCIRSFDAELANKLVRLNNDETGHMMSDVVKLLELFIYSNYGELFNTTDKPDINIINLKESILNNELVLFLFDASAYAEDTRKVAKMVINDLNSCFAEFNSFTPCLCIFDEFASYASENLSETISLHRSNGLHAVVGTQSVATVKLKSRDTKRVAEELIACCNTFIVHRLNHNEDVEMFANIMGTKDTYDVSHNNYSDTNNSAIFNLNKPKDDIPRIINSVKIVEKHKIKPQRIKDLKTGEAIILRKVINSEPFNMQICKAGANLEEVITNQLNSISRHSISLSSRIDSWEIFIWTTIITICITVAGYGYYVIHTPDKSAKITQIDKTDKGSSQATKPQKNKKHKRQSI